MGIIKFSIRIKPGVMHNSFSQMKNTDSIAIKLYQGDDQYG